MKPKNPTEIECWSLLVCAYVHLFLRKDSRIWKTQKFQNKWLKERRETREDRSILSKGVLFLKIEQAAPDGLMLQRFPEETGVFPGTETSSLG